MRRLIVELILILGLLGGLITVGILVKWKPTITTATTVVEVPIVTRSVETVEVVAIPEPTETVELSNEVTTTTYRVSAYCACEECCGEWASDRPLNDEGLPIVYGASGDVLENEVSVASPLPFGTNITLNGYGTVIVHDRTADWIVDKYGSNVIDLYFNDHEKALEWGVKYLEGVVN